jgi:hypothetical protein
MERTNTSNIQEFLMLQTQYKLIRHDSPYPHIIGNEPNMTREYEKPNWLTNVIEQIKVLQADLNHLERDHEDVVASFFETLGYRRTKEIKFQRGRIDIRVDVDGKPRFTIEVKSSWSIKCGDIAILNQAYSYANQVGSPYVIVTNGDLYCIYDRTKGLSYNDHLFASFKLTELNSEDLKIVDNLKKVAL